MLFFNWIGQSDRFNSNCSYSAWIRTPLSFSVATTVRYWMTAMWTAPWPSLMDTSPQDRSEVVNIVSLREGHVYLLSSADKGWPKVRYPMH
ncbi:hypothetical protein D3C80_1640560 [compost metagenome]